MDQVITQEIKDANKIEFDRITEILTGQGYVISKIKEEIIATRNKYATMIIILQSFPDQISELEKQLYDTQSQAFMHAIFMYLGYRDNQGNQFINPVTPESQTTDVTLTLTFPHYTSEKVIATVDNISVDILSWNVYIGTTALNALNSTQIQAQYDTTVEQPEEYFSRNEFITGVSFEIEKLLLFNAQICRLEQVINAGLRYISELKNLGLYN